MKPKFVPEFNYGHLLTAVMLAGSVLGVWRASELRAIDTKAQQELIRIEMAEMKRHVANLEDEHKLVINRLEGLQVNQIKVATLLDDHLKYFPVKP